MMGTFTNELVNVRELEMPLANDGMTNVRDELRIIITNLLSSTGGQGGIVYFPPGGYRIYPDLVAHPIGSPLMQAISMTMTQPGADVRFPPNVMLWFAPGAKLVIDREAVVLIEGSIRAELTQIFDCIAENATQRQGLVVLQSLKVLELYPEWWGAISWPRDASDDTRALNDCIRAAHTHREFPSGLTFPIIPIILSGQYAVGKEIVIQDPSQPARSMDPMNSGSAPDLRMVTGTPNTAGIILYGRRGTGAANAGIVTLGASGSFPSPSTIVARDQPIGRALLRIDGILGSLIEGIGFNGGDRSSVCVQITGRNAKATVFRNCSFSKARHVQVQVGDYVIESRTESATPVTGGDFAPPLAVRTSRTATTPPDISWGGYDLSGLTFENCIIDSGLVAGRESSAHDQAVVGLVFNANQTFPMTLEQCAFQGLMLACVEAYGGTMIIRGGRSQNQLPRQERSATPGERRKRPSGGVDIFIGDPLLPNSSGNATPPTGLTVLQYESQSDRFLDTFRHVSASSGLTAFFPTVLQGVSARATSAPSSLLGASIFWCGPSISPSGMRAQSRGGTLTLIGCTFRGPRGIETMRVPPDGEPTGVVVVDHDACLVADIGTRFSPVLAEGRSIFWEFSRSSMGDRFTSVSGGPAFPWYVKM